MNPILTRIDKIVIDLFRSLYDKISDLRVVKRTNIKDNMNICYNIEHLFHVVLNYCFYIRPVNDCIPEASNLSRLCKSSLSYWLSKVYSIDHVYSFYKIIYNISKNFPKTYFIRSDDILTNIINRYNVYACDGTYSTLNITNRNGKSCSSFELSILLDISNNMIYDYSFCFDCNETNALMNTALFKSDIVILDRGYSSYDLMDHLYKKTNFVLRIKSNLSIAQKLIDSTKNSIIVEHNQMKLKLIMFSKNHKNNFDDKHLEGNANDSLYILCTNLTDLTFDECQELYKRRWKIETANKYLKSNLNLRNIKTDIKSKNPFNKIYFTVSIDIMMYNLAMINKNILDRELFIKKISSILLKNDILNKTKKSNILINKLPFYQNIHICVDINELSTNNTINMAHFLQKYKQRILTTINLIASKETTLDDIYESSTSKINKINNMSITNIRKIRTPKKGIYKSTITILTDNLNKKLLRLLNKSVKNHTRIVNMHTKKYMKTINTEIKEINNLIISTILY